MSHQKLIGCNVSPESADELSLHRQFGPKLHNEMNNPLFHRLLPSILYLHLQATVT